MSENLIASLQVGRTSPSMSVEEYRARKVALITGKLSVSLYFGPFFFFSPPLYPCYRLLYDDPFSS